ncbi:MAG: dihydrodipicolinate synthase family protein [Chthoniobacter sp.]
MQTSPTPLTGLVAAPYTPFHADGSLNLPVIDQLAASLVANGVTGAFVCGTTGEGVSLTVEERQQVAERWQQAAGSQLRVIVHVGHTSLADARSLAAHAEKIGAHGVGCLAPFFFKPATIEDLAGFCAEVAAAAPALPFYYYQIPSMTGVSLSAADFLRAAAPRIPNLAGVKFTFENLMDFAECVRLEGGRYDIVFGRDEILVAGLALGARGAIGSTYNFLAPIFHEVIAAFEKGDLARARGKAGGGECDHQDLHPLRGLARRQGDHENHRPRLRADAPSAAFLERKAGGVNARGTRGGRVLSALFAGLSDCPAFA